tara:strand:- start:614 stop:1093 length:480 start_codon:yes stop_codon:yes gene_type:complete
MNNYNLKSEWCLWYHSINDNNWGINSYKLLYEFKDLHGLYALYNLLTNKILINGMYFIMKKGVLPIWEDATNINGGCLSYKIQYENLSDKFKNILLLCLSDNLYKNKTENEYINGISLSPKKTFNICKIWYSKYFDNILNIEKNNSILDQKLLFKYNKV